MSDKSYDQWIDHVRDRCEECPYLNTEWICGALHTKISEIRSCGINERRIEDEQKTNENL